jgi:arsenate reductase (glutaredoxin)
MASITLYGLKNCDACRKAITALEGSGHSVRFTDIRTEADLEVLLPRWIDRLGADTLINRRSTSWRALDPAITADPVNFTTAGAAKLLCANPTLIKRPVIESDEKLVAGWSRTVEAAF